MMTVENIVAKSSNIGSAKIAIYKLGEQKLYDYIKAYGFGARTAITLGGEVSGRVNPFTKADKLAISRVPIGQSHTPTQPRSTVNGGPIHRVAAAAMTCSSCTPAARRAYQRASCGDRMTCSFALAAVRRAAIRRRGISTTCARRSTQLATCTCARVR